MLLYNNQFLPESDLKLPITNRAFQYNDGFFETIIVADGKLRFWEEHLERMREAAASLQVAIPDYFWDGELEERLLELAGIESASGYGRLKLKVWRSGAGLYTPQSHEIEWLATAAPSQAIPASGIKVGLCQTVRTFLSPLSHFKGPHAPLYVLAGIEKRARAFDDMLLLSAEGDVAELISSNIFWSTGGTLFTPSLATGCVNGVMRRSILRWCLRQGIAVQEMLAKPEELAQADAVFAANVTGIRGIEKLENHQLQLDKDWLQILKTGLQV